MGRERKTVGLRRGLKEKRTKTRKTLRLVKVAFFVVEWTGRSQS